MIIGTRQKSIKNSNEIHNCSTNMGEVNLIDNMSLTTESDSKLSYPEVAINYYCGTLFEEKNESNDT